MSDFEDKAKQVLKSTLKGTLKKVIILILVVLVVVSFLAGAVYYLTIDDGTYKENDWGNTNYGASQYINNVSVNSDGTISSSMTANDLWDEMKKNGGRVDQYLDSPEELARLMKAEIVTQYPDTRSAGEIDNGINWDDIINNADSMQGIVKFKRADSNGSNSRMTYVDYNQFLSWIEEYNETGNENIKNAVLSHFTLSESTVYNGGTSDINLEYSGDNQWTDISEAIVRAALDSYKNQTSPGAGLCQAWVREIYQKAGLGNGGAYPSAYAAYQSTCVSKDSSNIPIGAAVYGTGSKKTSGKPNIYGHVGIYVGDINGDGVGEVIDNVGSIKVSSLSDWIGWQEKAGNTACGETPGFLGWGWQSGQPTRFLDENEIKETENRLQTTSSTTQVVVNNGITSVEQSKYQVIVATWQQTDTKIKTNDPDVQEKYEIGEEETVVLSEYNMTTSIINYQEMVRPYGVPFDFLWALLVVGEQKEFVFEIADLIYNSDIEITVYDNLTINTDVNDWKYNLRTKAEVQATVRASYYDSESKKTYRASNSLNTARNDVHDPYGDDIVYNTTKTVITKTNTVNTVLTRANVWITDYKNDYTYSQPAETSNSTETVEQDDQEYLLEPTYTQAGDDVTFDCEHIDKIKENVINNVLDQYMKDESTTTNNSNKNNSSSNKNNSSNSSQQKEEKKVKVRPSNSAVKVNVNFEKVEYFEKYINISDSVSNQVVTQQYISGTPDVIEKTDPDADEPNFVNIYKQAKYQNNSKNISSASSWLFEIIESNQSTKDMLDLTKYLLYKATGSDYGVKALDINSFLSSRSLVIVGENDYIVNIDKSDSNIVITDVDTLKRAFSGYSGDSELQKYASYFLEYQEKYRVNAIFAAAVSISETSAGRAGHAIDGKNNWFNIECTCGNSSHGRFETYYDARASIERFFWQIAQGKYYFTEGRYTVATIGMKYCENADAPGGWIQKTTTFMAQMLNASGVLDAEESSSETGARIVEAAKSRLGCDYVKGDTGPNTFDCSGLTWWCYQQVGINIQRTSGDQYTYAPKKVPVSEARVGDILWKSGHVAIYIGNGQCIEAPQPGKTVKVSKNINRFTWALQYY